MKKFALSLVVAGAVASCTFAQGLPKGVFFGAEGGVAHQFIKPDNYSGSGWDITNLVLGIKGGYDFGDFRVYGQINHNFEAKNDKNLKFSNNEFLGGADYYIHSSRGLKLFVGGYGGADFREKRWGDSSWSKLDKALMLGAKFGGIYSVDKTGKIEFGAKLDKPFHENFSITKFTIFSGYTYKF